MVTEVVGANVRVSMYTVSDRTEKAGGGVML
jgi:hypothetical protein